MKITIAEKNTYVVADEGKLLYFVGDENGQGFTEGYFPGIAKEEDFVEKEIEELGDKTEGMFNLSVPVNFDLNNIIEK